MPQPKLTTLKEGMAKECTLPTLQSYITPNELFFVRHRYPVPTLDAVTWSLEIGGEVETERSLSLRDLKQLPERKLVVTTECAGNGRTMLDPPTSGLQFSTGAIGTAEWTGVSLHDVLSQVGVKSGAVEVLMTGADRNADPHDPNLPECYERSIKLEKALHPDTLLAFKMNGEDLPIEHGYPVRAIIPGWYGMASVKWLERIELISKHFDGHYQKNEYVIKQPGESPRKPVEQLLVKSLIASPESGQSVRAGRMRIQGVAWGAAGIERVDVSLNGGKSWQAAKLGAPKSPYAWLMWHTDIDLLKGEQTLMARATDNSGTTQPLEAEWNELGYELNPVHKVKITAQ